MAFSFSITPSIGQNGSERDFYTYLQTQITQASAKNDTIVIIEETKACFGSAWKAIIKPESDFTTVVFYIDKTAEVITETTTNLYQTIVDTAFTLPTSTLLDNLESEIKNLKSTLLISYTTTEYLIRRGDTKRRFKLEKGQGLYYWLRFNKSWTQYLEER